VAGIDQKIDKLIHFIKYDIWKISLADFSRGRAWLLYRLRILVLALRGFIKDNGALRASALTFYTLLSLVPVMAMVLGIAKGFGIQSVLKKRLRETLSEHQEVLTQVLTFANSLLENMPGGIIAGVGVAILVWTVIKVMSNIEESFNQIWNIKTARSWLRKFTDYLAIVIIGPLLFIISSSLTLLITARLAEVIQNLPLSALYGPFVLFLLKAAPYSLIWVLFFLIYLFMPNTRVNIMPAIYAAIIAGTIYQLTQWLYLEFQIGVSRNNAIYGSFAAIPLFLIWLQISWSIVLFGGELAFSIQNVRTYTQEVRTRDLNHFNRKLLSLLLCQKIVKAFQQEEAPPDDEKLADASGIPVKLVRDLVQDLVEGGLVSRVQNNASDYVFQYQPAHNIESYTVQYVLQKLDRINDKELKIPQDQAADKLRSSMEAFAKLQSESSHNLKLKDI